jgi:hypothetical protein
MASSSKYCNIVQQSREIFPIFLVKYLVSIPGIIALILGETTGEIKKGFQELRQQVEDVVRRRLLIDARHKNAESLINKIVEALNRQMPETFQFWIKFGSK